MEKDTQDIVDRPDKDGDKPSPAEKPISLHPLEFEEAVKGLLDARPIKIPARDNKRDDG